MRLGRREVRHMENDRILQARFFSDCLDFGGQTEYLHAKLPVQARWFALAVA